MKKLVALAAILVVAGALFAQATDKFMVDYERAEKLLEQKNYEQAYEIYNKLIRDAGSRGFAAEIKYRAAQCAYNLGRFSIAIQLLEKILNEDIPADSRYAYLEPQVKFSLGLSYFQVEDIQRAQRFLDEAEALGGMGISDYLIRSQQDPDNAYKTAYDHLKEREYPVDKLFLARTLIKLNDPASFSEIRFLLTDLSEDLTLEELVDFSRAEMQFFNQDYATAKNVFRDFMTKYPQTSLRDHAQYYLACSYYHEREYRYAIDLLSKLTDPNKSGYVLAAHAYFMRGEAYRELDLSDSAMFSFEQARIVAPNSMVDFYTTYRLYQIYRDEGNLDVARREAQKLGSIALSGRDQNLMRSLSNFVRGNIEFDQANYIESLNYYREVTMQPPQYEASPEEVLVYESAMAMHLLTLNRQNNNASYGEAMTKPQTYLRDYPDSIPLQYGGDWRAYLLYNQADATYYSSYDPLGRIRNTKRREEARDEYQVILDEYPDSYMSTLAKVALAWYKLEANRLDDALYEFDAIINTTLKTDALVLAAYGKALAYFYKGDYANAGNWFFTEEEYMSGLRVTVSREDEKEGIRYNEIADSLIDQNLFWRGTCLELLGGYGDALEIYQHIADAYPNRPKAGEAWQKIIEFYILAKQADKAVSAVEEVKAKKTQNPRIYKDAYGFGLAQLYNYYFISGNNTEAETYAKRLTSELGNTEYIEQLYYTLAIKDTSVADIGDLREKIELISTRNPRSKWLPEPMFLLSALLIEEKSFDQAKEVLIQLKNWPNAEATRDIMPEITYQLARVYFQTESFQDASTQFEQWTRYYETGDNARIDLAPYVYYFLALSYYNLGDQETSPQVRAGFYRKAITDFQLIGDRYADSDFYKQTKSTIDQFIAQCKKKIG